MDKLNVVVLTSDLDLRVYIKNQLEQLAIISGYADYNESGTLKIQGMYPDVVLCVYKGEVPDEIFGYIHELLCVVHNCVVVMLCEDIDVSLVSRAAQAGILKVLPLDTPSEQLVEELQRIYALEWQRRVDSNATKKVRSKVIGFFGGKGGTGKTTLSLNVASTLAKTGKRTILIDLDLQFGDLALALDLDPKDTIVELVQDRVGITIENINSFALVHSSGMSVLCAPKSAEYAEYITPEHIERLIDVCRPYFEYIVLDLPPAFNDVSIAAVENSDELFLVYNMEILSLKNAKSFLAVLEQLHQKDKARLIINKNYKGLIKRADFERVLDMPIYGVVSMDIRSSTSAVNKGQPIVICEPHSATAKEMSAIAARIVQEHTGILTIQQQAGRRKKRREKKSIENDQRPVQRTL